MGAHFSFGELLRHPDTFLHDFMIHYGAWAYLAVFVIVFCETGLVVTPFLPGDSLLFAAGMIAYRGEMNPLLLCVTLVFAALLGDNVNYLLGSRLGRKLFHNEKSKIFNKRSLDKTHAFFERYGGRTVIIARFLPVFRTFAPFVAGMGKMRYRTFMLYSIVAASLWVFLCVTIGYSVSRAPWARDHFSLMLLALILVSAVPGVVEIARHWRAAKHEHHEPAVVAGTPEGAAE